MGIGKPIENPAISYALYSHINITIYFIVQSN